MKKKLVGTARDFRDLCIQFSIIMAVITFVGLIMAIVGSIWALFITPLCLTIISLFGALAWHIKYINETIEIQEQIKYEQEQTQKKLKMFSF